MERLAALGRAQNLIGEGLDEDVPLETLIKTALNPFETKQFALDGPSLMVGKDVGVSLALLIHELATNAAKHGALSSTAGMFEISWLEESPKKGCLNWKERFGQTVSQPSQAGFGSRLIRTALLAQRK
jgi:two-component sensor histidine kinase